MSTIDEIKLYAITVFGDQTLAEDWLTSFHDLLQAKPIDLLGDDDGSLKVRKILAAIEHGLPV